jgi:hypothetical protein
MSMKDDILTYREMCDAENVQTIQRGMNYRLHPSYTVVLMSQRTNAPYRDEILQDGLTIVYEGHDQPKSKDVEDPKHVDQLSRTLKGTLTQNGKFVEAVKRYQDGDSPERVKVFEKLFSGVWSYKGLFLLQDYRIEEVDGRDVFKFYLTLSAEQQLGGKALLPSRSRIIPTEIKKLVWQRDHGRCVMCGATDELHFDHDIPYSKGGTSITADNVRILCARHNLGKSDKIE